MSGKPPDIPRLAVSYRRLILWFGVQVLLSIAAVLIRSLSHQEEPPLPFAAASWLVTLGTLVALGIYAYRTADAFGSPVPILWVIAMVVPCVNVIPLAMLSSKAASVCRASGIPVGLFGPKLSAVPRKPEDT